MNTEITIIDNSSSLIEIFQDGSKFIRTNKGRRAFGPDRLSEQIILDQVDIKVPIYFGTAPPGHQGISQIRSQVQSEYPHLVFNGGKYTGLNFNLFGHPQSAEPNVLLPYRDLTVEINGGDFHEPIRFSNSNLASIKIAGGTFHSEVCFERGVYDCIEITGGDFKRGLFFGSQLNFDKYNTSFLPPPAGVPNWTSRHNGIYKYIKIRGEINVADIVINKCFVENELLIDVKDIRIEIKDFDTKGTIKIKEGICSISKTQAEIIVLGGPKITSKIVVDTVDTKSNTIIFEGYNGRESLISFRNQESSICKFEHFINYGSITFNNFEIVNKKTNFQNFAPSKLAQRLSPKNFNNQLFYSQSGNAQISTSEVVDLYKEALKDVEELTESQSIGSIQFINSDVGKTAFFGSKLGNVELHFKNSKLTEIFLAGTEFPQNIDGFADESQRRLAISQIKKVYESRGDNVTAREYLSRELEVYRGELREENDWRSFHERISLWLNFISTRHGRDWFQAFYLLLGFGALCWCIIGLCLGFHFTMSWNINTISDFVKASSYFFQFLLPIHKIDLIEDFFDNVVKDGIVKPFVISHQMIRLPIAQLIDILWRIISAYLVYQLIAAFRKHGSK